MHYIMVLKEGYPRKITSYNTVMINGGMKNGSFKGIS